MNNHTPDFPPLTPRQSELLEAIKAEKEIIRIESEALARLRGLDPERVKGVFQRLAEVGWSAPNFPFNTALDEAFGYFEPAEALYFFEREDLAKLAQNVAIVDYLGDKWTPFYSLEELAEIFEAFIDNQPVLSG